MGCDDLCDSVGIYAYGAQIAPFFSIATKNKLLIISVRRVAEYNNTRHNSINCHQPPDHQRNGGFLITKTGVEIMKANFLTAGLVVAAGLATLAPKAHAANSRACEICKTLTEHLDTTCAKAGCTPEQMYTVLETQINSWPQNVMVMGTEFMNLYGDMLIDLYLSGMEPIQICITIGVCEDDSGCTGCTNCTSDVNWAAGNTGYQFKVSRSCDCNTCIESTAYRCASGYYGTSTNGTSGCSQCPSSGGINGMSDAGSTEITSCYLPSGTTGSDSTGSWTYTDNCYYIN